MNDDILTVPPAVRPEQRVVDYRRVEVAAQILAGLALLAVLELKLLSALFAGLLLYQLVCAVGTRLRHVGVTGAAGNAVALGLFVAIIGGAIWLGVVALASSLTGRPDSIAALLQKMAETIEQARAHMPWAASYLPTDTDELQSAASKWLREHAGQLQSGIQNAGVFLVHTLIGLVIGAIVALSHSHSHGREPGPLARALTERAHLVGLAFRRVVFAQARISALNTALTAIYLLIVLPILGVSLPLTKTIIVLTFIAGLLPVIGNLISNTVIVVVSLSVSPYVALGSLGFLVLIHKLEYFVNARIIGSRIGARAWELLLAMLVMETAFGLPGVIAAPIFYAYLKDELAVRKLL